MRILWHSVKPTIPSGYGTQTKLIVPQIKALGYEVAISCTVGTCGATEVWNGIKMFPDSGHLNRYGMDMIQLHAQKWKADLVISWLDAFVIPPDTARKVGKWAAWVPVDSYPLMPKNIDPLKAVRWTIAPTWFGVRQLNKAGFPDAHLLPCAYDSLRFKYMDHDDAKQRFGSLIGRDLTNKFLVNVVSANAGDRKNYQAIFAAWAEFRKKHHNAVLYIHADISGYFSQGADLMQMAKIFDLHTVDDIIFADQWNYVTGQLGEEYLALSYAASDVHLNTCFGEGFGLPIMEAQACGCPTIVPDFAAAVETGLCYKIQEGTMMATVPGARQLVVSVPAVVKALELAYEENDTYDREALSTQTAYWKIENVVKNHLVPLLKKLEQEVTE